MPKAVLSRVCYRLQECVPLRDQAWSTHWTRRRTLWHRPGHHPRMPVANGRSFTVGANGADAGRGPSTKVKADAADLLRACVRTSAFQLADELKKLWHGLERSGKKNSCVRHSEQW